MSISATVRPSARSGKLTTSLINVRAKTVEPAPINVTFTTLRSYDDERARARAREPDRRAHRLQRRAGPAGRDPARDHTHVRTGRAARAACGRRAVGDPRPGGLAARTCRTGALARLREVRASLGAAAGGRRDPRARLGRAALARGVWLQRSAARARGRRPPARASRR